MTTTPLLISPPARSPAQRTAALAKANQVRTHRAQVKRDIATRPKRNAPLALIAHVEAPGPLMATMPIRDLLLACPGLGPGKARRLLVVAGVSPSKTLGGLSDRQRAALAACLHHLRDQALANQRRR